MDGKEIDLLDVMNPAGMFLHGHRQREYSTKDILPLSGKLIPEFDGRRNIRDMFSRKNSLLQSQSTKKSFTETGLGASQPHSEVPCSLEQPSQINPTTASNEYSIYDTTPDPLSPVHKKRPLGETFTSKPLKRAKSSSTATMPATNSNGQRSLKVFFKPKAVPNNGIDVASPDKEKGLSQLSSDRITLGQDFPETAEITESVHKLDVESPNTLEEARRLISYIETSPSSFRKGISQKQNSVHDPVESKDSWSKLFTKPVAPRCEGHNEPCISLMTKKSGMNCRRSFWMCSRPLGPTGAKERNTQWRCQTFIWCSDWNSITARDSVQ